MSDHESKLDATTPQKRQRSDSNGDPRMRSEYWFEDGNVILQAEDTLFRVHQSILSRHSQIFKDTFTIPQSPQDSEHIEACPVILLSDTTEDMVNIISLLYDSDQTLNFFKKISARFLGSMLRLGRKYDIAYIEKKALEVLHNMLPTTFQDWDDSLRINKHSLTSITEFISIAHEFRLFTKLPAAYALYLQQQNLANLPNDTRIPEKAREHCIIGYARIQGYIKGSSVDAFCPPFLPSKECSTRGRCDANRWEAIKNLPIWAIEERRSFGIFGPWKSKGPKATENLCSRCRTEAKNLTDKVRSEFWSLLPTLFGLPSWTDLKDEF